MSFDQPHDAQSHDRNDYQDEANIEVIDKLLVDVQSQEIIWHCVILIVL